MSLSLMGSNSNDYLKEAYRTLKSFGFLFICEPIEKWKGKIDNLENILKEIGFNIYGEIKKTKNFIYITAVK